MNVFEAHGPAAPPPAAAPAAHDPDLAERLGARLSAAVAALPASAGAFPRRARDLARRARLKRIRAIDVRRRVAARVGLAAGRLATRSGGGAAKRQKSSALVRGLAATTLAVAAGTVALLVTSGGEGDETVRLAGDPTGAERPTAAPPISARAAENRGPGRSEDDGRRREWSVRLRPHPSSHDQHRRSTDPDRAAKPAPASAGAKASEPADTAPAPVAAASTPAPAQAPASADAAPAAPSNPDEAAAVEFGIEG